MWLVAIWPRVGLFLGESNYYSRIETAANYLLTALGDYADWRRVAFTGAVYGEARGQSIFKYCRPCLMMQLTGKRCPAGNELSLNARFRLLIPWHVENCAEIYLRYFRGTLIYWLCCSSDLMVSKMLTLEAKEYSLQKDTKKVIVSRQLSWTVDVEQALPLWLV